MIQKTLWKPDTCGCEIEYQWDSSVPQDERVHTLSTIFRCPLHENVSHAEAYQAVLDENKSKNMAIGVLCDNVEKLRNRAEEVRWRFDQDRNVVISHPDLNEADKNLMKDVPMDNIVKQVSIE